jgi:hypothetical protein
MDYKLVFTHSTRCKTNLVIMSNLSFKTHFLKMKITTFDECFYTQKFSDELRDSYHKNS